MKKILTLIALMCILYCLPLVANAASVGDLTFDTKTGTITDCKTDAEGDLVIPAEIDGATVKAIGDSAFSECTGLTDIIIPDNVTSIGESAFYGCESLTSVKMPNGVKNIGYSMFSQCTSLQSIRLPDSVTNIDINAFRGCNNLRSITIPNKLKVIHVYAFERCNNLADVYYVGTQQEWEKVGISDYNDPILNAKIHYMMWTSGDLKFNALDGIIIDCDENATGELTIPDEIDGATVKAIGDSAFSECKNLTVVNIPNSVTSIGLMAFYQCANLKKVNIPDGVTDIGYEVFFGCSSLENIDVPNSVINIGESAFSGCSSLKSIDIPSSVVNIGNFAFGNCSDLEAINVNPENKHYTSVDGILFNSEKTELILYPRNKRDASYSIPDGVTSIGGAFQYCSNLTELIIPDSVTNASFLGCSSLIELTIPKGIESLGNQAFNKCSSLKSVHLSSNFKGFGVEKIPSIAFDGCTSLTEITVDENNENYTSIDGVLYDKNVTGIYVIPPGKKNITIPSTVGDHPQTNYNPPEYINYALRDATALETIEVENGNEKLWTDGTGLYNADRTTLYGIPRSVNKNTYRVPDNTTSIDSDAFYKSCVTDIFIPKSVTFLGRTSLYGCMDIYYEGSQEEWNAIKTLYSYYNPTMHFNATGMEPPKICVVKPISNNVEIELEDAEYDSNMIAVSTGDNNQMLTMDKIDIKAGDTQKTAEIPEGAKTVKVFIWDSLYGMKPLCPAVEMPVE